MLKVSIVFCQFLLITSVVAESTERSPSERELQENILNRMLGPSYNKNIKPSGYLSSNSTQVVQPTVVSIDLYIRSIDFIDDVKMEYGLQITFRQRWYDDRLTFEDGLYGEYITLTDHSKLWIPDVFISNERRSELHNNIMPNVLVRIFPNGTVLFSTRLTLVMKCYMNLKKFPFDSPSCHMKIASYAMSTKDVILKWNEEDPVQIPKAKLELPRFDLQSHSIRQDQSSTTVGKFSSLCLDFKFQRNLTYYLVQIYLPSCMLVIISWVGFWLEETATDARISLGVTTILTMVTQIYGINQTTPPVSYIKALDIWTGACEAFVVAALLQFSLVNHAVKVERKQEMNLSRKKKTTKHIKMYEHGSGFWKFIGLKRPPFFKTKSKAKKIDIASRVLFPFCFVVFNIIYWIIYLSEGND